VSDFAIELNRRLSKAANGIAEDIMNKLSDSTGIPLKFGKQENQGENQGERKTDNTNTGDSRPSNPFADQIVQESPANKLQKLARSANSDSSDPVEVMRALARKNEQELRYKSGNPRASDSEVVGAYLLDRTIKLNEEKKLESTIGRTPDMNDANDFSRAIRQVKEVLQRDLGATPNNDADLLKRISHNLSAAQFQKAGVPAPSYEQIKK